MCNENIRQGDIIVESYGYSMTLYNFWRVVRLSEKSMWLQKLPKLSDGDFMEPNVRPDCTSFSGEVVRKSRKTYIGWVWDGKSCTENHWD